MDVTRTFVDAVAAGEATPDQLDERIGLWHAGAGRGMPLADLLGLSWDEYAAWAQCRATEAEVVEAAIARRRAEGGGS